MKQDVESSRLAFMLEGVPAQWQMNVLQVLAKPAPLQVALEGQGDVDVIGYQITRDQARHLATQIAELLGTEAA
jgi:hypothetical protein